MIDVYRYCEEPGKKDADTITPIIVTNSRGLPSFNYVVLSTSAHSYDNTRDACANILFGKVNSIFFAAPEFNVK